MNFPQHDIPSSPVQLLVSVRTVEELPDAITGGADIIDIKDTSRGSLGMADLDVIQQIHSQLDSKLPLSAALGELKDRQNFNKLTLKEFPALNYLKIGLSGMGDRADWKSIDLEFRNGWEEKLSFEPKWVSVIYADWKRSRSPSPNDVIEHAIESGSSVVLYDTAIKDGKTLLDHLSIDDLQEQAGLIHSAGLRLALAGSLKKESLSRLAPVEPDIVAIRGAACRDGNRQKTIHREAIAEFKKEMARIFSEPSVTPTFYSK